MSILRNKQLLWFFLIILIFIFSCSSASEPPLSEAQKIFLQKKVTVEDGSNLYKVVNFNKINSYKQNIFGLDAHVMVYEAMIEITNNCYLRSPKGPEAMFGEGIKLRITKPQFMGSDYDIAQKGKLIKLQGELPFVKTERGWQLAL